MRRSRFTLADRTMAQLLGLLFAVASISMQAQVTSVSHPQHPVTVGYDRAHEITINGTIEKLVSHSAPGSPVGLHLFLTTSQGAVDAHVGPYLTKDVQKQLTAGTTVQIVGAKETVHGKSYMLVRQLIFGGRLINVRTTNGFLMSSEAPRPVRARAPEKGEQANGGAR
jgi:hypothetical protein